MKPEDFESDSIKEMWKTTNCGDFFQNIKIVLK